VAAQVGQLKAAGDMLMVAKFSEMCS